MNILAVADLHYDGHAQKLRSIANKGVDVVVALGDISFEFYQAAAEIFPAQPKLAVMGNHDYGPASAVEYGFQHLDMTAASVGSLTFAGFDGSIRYKPGRGFMWTQDEAMERVKTLPPADVLITHAPPYSLAHAEENDDPAHVGLKAFDWYIRRYSPKLALCGHLHVNQPRHLNGTMVWQVYEAQIIKLRG